MTLGGTMTETSSSLESPLPRVPPARPVACDHPAMEVKGASAISFDSRSGVAPHDSDTFRLPLSSSSSELSARWSFLLLFAPLLFANRDMAHATPIALAQCARGSKFWRRPTEVMFRRSREAREPCM